jgi:hypothetical protein
VKTPIILLIALYLSSCSIETSGCYKIEKINLAIETPRIESVFYRISDKKIIERISGDSLVGDYVKSKVSEIIFVKNGDTIDKTDFTRFKKTKDGVLIIYRTMRFHQYGDSINVSDEIRKENIILRLENNATIQLKYCE